MPSAELHTVLVPGLACSSRLWDTLLPTAWSRGATTIADTRRDTSIAGIADRLLADAPPRFALAGISMGGYVCLEVMRRAPERVRGLALISTAAAPDTPEQAQSRRVQLTMAREGRYDDLVTAAFPVLVDENKTELAELWTTMAHEVGVDAFLTQLQAVIDRSDTRPVLPHIACPTAVIHGLGDRTIPVQNAHETAAAIPHARLTLVDDAGHMAAHEQPEQVSAAFADLLDQAAESAPESE
jgi:pimeloyl-ACP methyl ester carboxylesterase